MCDIWKREETNAVTAADLERHRESLRHLRVEWVVLTGGEPLMNHDLSALGTFFRELGIRLTLLTTGLLLERRARDVSACFDDVIVSLDGPPEVHDRIRRVKGSYDLIDRGVAAVRALRPALQITARSTVQKLNHSRLRQTALAAKDVGFDGISFLAADTTSEAFNRPVQWPDERRSEIALSVGETIALEHEVEELIAWSAQPGNEGFVAESPAKLRKLVQHFRAHLGQGRFQAPKCNAPWVSAVIESDGTVRPCFFHDPVGNIHIGSLEEVVNGETARTFRRHLDVASNSVCQRCVCSLYRAS
jgi:MoaA/NifB/PqqE/SkfB family radical SAM enzyme